MSEAVHLLLERLAYGDQRAIGRAITLTENHAPEAAELLAGLNGQAVRDALILGITGPPGAGKSTLSGALIGALRAGGERVGVIAVDPSSPITGGAILGDRIRMMEHALDPGVIIRSMASRGRLGGLCAAAGTTARIMAGAGCRVVLLETVGIGQSEMDIVRLADLTLMVLAPGFGDEIQAMKAGILEVCDLLVVNKADQPGSERLLLDMAPLFGRVDAPQSRLLATAASEGRGVSALLERILQLEAERRGDASFARRRAQAAVMETTEWLVELLRPRLRELAAGQPEAADPYLTACNLIRQIAIQ